MQVSTTVVAAVDSVTKLTRLYLARNFKDDKGSVKYLKYGGGELSNLISLTDVVTSSSYLWGENEYVSSRELLDSIPQEMVLQLGSELSDVWRVTDDMVGKITRSWVKLDSTWIYNPDTNHYYKVLDCGTWEQCETQARTLGRHLVTINDQAENDWLVNAFGTTYFWIGFSDYQQEGNWVWTSGESVTYTNWNWQESEPNGGTLENYAHLNWGHIGGWNDTNINAGGSTTQAIIELAH
ncbi:C-type lectin domain-containing protein [Methylovulum sp.]|uniref:C-type lectin domain-containing protein n=1 Tax=Methylovulum sp. TaxID=1916980 RepID=UPI00262F9ED5|nr:C-type lectin domain-containing protein [Methylovulum sp.]MDD5125840.1 C-type lectin domain-containing protein [Methylovulum sp.]